jgi:adenylyl cyclase-associated protein
LNGNFSSFQARANKVGDLASQHAELLHKALLAELELIKLAAKSKKPADLQGAAQPVSQAVTAVVDFREKNRVNKDYFNFLSAVSEGVPSLGWVLVTPTPVPFIEEAIQAAKFYTNKILTEFKGKDQNKAEYANLFIDFLKDLQVYVKKNHTTGLAWNPKGGDVGSPAPIAAPSPIKPKPAAGGEPSSETKSSLFAALNQGDNVTTSLKHVTKDMKTKNLPPEQKSSVVPASAPTTSATKSKENVVGGAPGSKPARFEREGVKWIIEHQVNNKNIVVSDTNPKQTVYIYKCADSVIQIQGKVNHITIDGCTKSGIVFEDAIAACEAVNCTSLQIQVTGKVPSIAIDKSSGVQVYLSKASLAAEIVTSKSSEMNILIPKGDDMVELPVPEQYITKVKDGKLVTETVAHAAA